MVSWLNKTLIILGCTTRHTFLSLGVPCQRPYWLSSAGERKNSAHISGVYVRAVMFDQSTHTLLKECDYSVSDDQETSSRQRSPPWQRFTPKCLETDELF